MNHICVNGRILPGEEPALLVSNRGYRYGDGLFETMKVYRETILLEQLHFERLFSGISVLKMDWPLLVTSGRLKKEVLDLCRKNKCEELARVRLSVFRGNGGLYDGDQGTGYVIECWPLDGSMNQLNENGLVTDIYPEARKSCDRFSNLKSASFQPYSMAARYAKEKKLNDCLVLNTSGNIADSTIANIFIIKDNIITTPALSEGCIDGVMRKYLISAIRGAGGNVTEGVLRPADLRQADEVFLTNAIRGIRWVRQFGERSYSNPKTTVIFNQFVKTIFT